MAPLILNLGTRWQRVVTTHPAGQNPMVSIEKETGYASPPHQPTHSRSIGLEKGQKILAPTGFEPRTDLPVA